MTQLRSDEISPERLLLDPNNYRFQDTEGFVYAADNRFHERSVQLHTFERLKKEENLILLKTSILQNGFVPVERIVVRPYGHVENLWVIIEGNRRVAAAKWIINDQDAGANILDYVIESIAELPVIVVEEELHDDVFRASLMGIRHVSGIKPWGSYQRSKLVVAMIDDLNLEASEVANRLAMRTQEVNRRYRAFKALQQMQEDEEFGGLANPSMYLLFHEALALPIVRDWLGWNENEHIFETVDNLYQFYGLITPHIDEEGSESTPKITTFAQVRELRNILPKPDARRLLLDPNHSIEDAIALAKHDELAREWVTDISVAINALNNMSVSQLKILSDMDLELLQHLADVVNERIEDHFSLSNE
jgi:hypothetical protein